MKRSREKRVCRGPGCDEVFTPMAANQVYCSKRCARRAAKRRPKYEPHIARCDICGGRYLKTSGHLKYCSPKCAREAKLKPRRVVKCPTCGRWFRPSPRFKRYCSPECRPEHLRRSLERRRAGKPEERFVCPYCDREVGKTRRDQRTCGSAECMAAMKRNERAAVGAVHDLTPDEREMLGLPDPKPGKVACLRCGKTFPSPDVRRFRLCPGCRDAAGRIARRHHLVDDMRGARAS